MSCYLFGCVHPEGEKDDYDGFFLRHSEFSTISKDLIGKPILFDHNEDCPVGKIISVWPCEKTKLLYMLGELHSDTLDAVLAKHAILNDVLKSFSLGHTVTIEDNKKVLAKKGVEVSICKQGARPNTHIYGIYVDKYISKSKSFLEKPSQRKPIQVSAMASTSPTTIEEQQSQQEQHVTQQKESGELNTKVFEQLKMLQNQNEALLQELETYKQQGKNEREKVIQNGVSEYVESLIASNPELEGYRDQIGSIMKSMVESDSATPLVKVLSAAASKNKGNINELEAAYQEQKKKDELIKSLQDELNTFKNDLFAESNSRLSRQNTQLFTGLASNTEHSHQSVENVKKKIKFSDNESTNDLFKDIDMRLKRSADSYSIPKFSPKELGFRERVGN